MIPPEEFSLETTCYKGVGLHDRLESLTPKTDVSRIQGDVLIDSHTSYSVIMARKFFAWLRSMEKRKRVSTLENRAIHESLTALFVNLTEFVHLDCRKFFYSFVYFQFIYVPSTVEQPYLIWEPIFTPCSVKTTYDVFTDSLLKCGLIKPVVRDCRVKIGHR